jgi:hypothetical protein
MIIRNGTNNSKGLFYHCGLSFTDHGPLSTAHLIDPQTLFFWVMVKKQLIIFPEELIEICSELDWC